VLASQLWQWDFNVTKSQILNLGLGSYAFNGHHLSLAFGLLGIDSVVASPCKPSSLGKRRAYSFSFKALILRSSYYGCIGAIVLAIVRHYCLNRSAEGNDENDICGF
jgi:hypothetical protein